MAIIHNTTHVSGTNSVPIDAFIGASFSDKDFGRGWQDDAVFFNGRFDEEERLLEERFIKPLDDMANQIIAVRKKLDAGLNIWRSIETPDDLFSMPPCMEEMVAVYAPVRKLAEQGRIRCYGLNVEDLPQNDFYGRITENFSCDDVGSSMDENGRYEWSAECYSDDPNISSEQQLMIWKARRVIDSVLKNTTADPTDPSVMRG